MRRRIFAFMLAAAVGGVGCQTLQDYVAQRQAITQVSWSLQGVELARLDLPLLSSEPRIDLKVSLAAKNPNAVTATLDRLDYDLLLEGSRVGSGKVTESFSVPAGGTGTLVVPVSIPLQGVPAAVLSAVTNRRAAMSLKATSHLQTPLGPLATPFELSHSLTF